MHSDKKRTKEDTWRPDDLKRHIRQGEYDDDYVRRRADNERKHRAGDSTERRHRDPEKESRRERDKLRERESTRERGHEDRNYTEGRKEGSHDRRGDKDRDREKRKERDRLVDENKYSDEYRDSRDRRRDREEKHDRERHRDRERNKAEDRDNRREERDKERRREERDRERRSDRERRRHEESAEGRRHETDRHHRETREHHGERERHRNEDKNEREPQEGHGKHKEESERRHRERRHHDEKRKHDSESKEHRDLKGPSGEVRHHRGDREHADKERRHRDDADAERKHRERRHREDDDHHERKNRDRRQREEEEDRDRKRQERKSKEDEDQERNHRDQVSSKKSSSDKGPHMDTIRTEGVEMVSELWTDVKDEGETEKLEAKDEDLADEEYEDDFEDYEEDFEDMDESGDEGEDEEEPPHPEEAEEREETTVTAQRRKEIEAIQRAIDEENERVGTAQSRQSARREEDRPKWSKGSEVNQSDASHRGRFIDFVAAKQREVSKKVASKQKKRSTELLRLIDLDFSMTFSLLDLQPVNEYDMYIRNFGTANTKQAYVQCNEDNADRDVQTEEIEMCDKWTQHPAEHNGACGDPNLSQEARDKASSELNFDSQRLASFLRSASQVMVVLMEEDRAERKSLRKLKTQTDTLSFSDGSLQLNTKLPFLYGRQVSLVHFSQVQRHTMMSVHMPTTKPSSVRLDSYAIICIWNIWEPSRPQKILVYESEVQCCCFSPGKAILVFAGTSVGSVLLWDLREHASNHYKLQIGEEEWTFRQPTFSTDAVLACSGHSSSVTSIEVVPSAVAGGLRPEVPLLASEEESSGLSFQLASLDESGALNFWVVVELPKGNEAGSPVDLGLRPGGKVKLLHSSSLLTAERASPRDAVKTGPLQTLLLKFLPTDSNHFFIGTNMGLVSHGTSHGLKAPPKFYRFQEVEVLPVDVSSIHFSPFKQHLFLVGCGDGSIRLHDVSREQPLAEWTTSTAGEPVVSLQWAQTRPTVFCALDAASNLHIWDLLKSDAEPVLTERMSADRVTAMAVFGDSGQQNTYSGVALAHESGKIEMQYFTRNLTVSSSAEEDKLESLMTEAF